MGYPPPNEEQHELNEPTPSYGAKPKPRLRIYNSFEEAAEAEARDAAEQSPIERIRETVELILRVYGVTREELMARKKTRRITIIRSK